MQKKIKDMIAEIINNVQVEVTAESRKEQVEDMMSLFELNSAQMKQLFEKVNSKMSTLSPIYARMSELSEDARQELNNIAAKRADYIENPTKDKKRSIKQAIYVALANMSDADVKLATELQRDIVAALK